LPGQSFDCPLNTAHFVFNPLRHASIFFHEVKLQGPAKRVSYFSTGKTVFFNSLPTEV